MTSRERVLSCLDRKGYDRIPVKHHGTPEVDRMLMDRLGLSDHGELIRALGDDFRGVGAAYRGPELRTFPDASWEGLWGERYGNKSYDGGTYPEAVYLPYAGIERVEDLDRSHFPSPEWYDFGTIKQQCEALQTEYAVCFGGAGDLDFMNGIGRVRGVQEVYEDVLTENEVFLELMDARFEFCYGMHERALQAAEGLIDLCLFGEDLGNQSGPMISMDTFERLFAQKFKASFDLAHRYGARTMMHMCGCVEAFLPRLIELGLDIQDVVQPTTPEMDVAYLQAHYGDKLAFCGTMCVQSVLPYGRTEDVEREVQRRLELFPDGGLILGPTHAVQVGTPLENILAMYRAAGSLAERL